MLHTRTPEERIAVAIMEANKEFYRQHKGGDPTFAFYVEFIEPFLEREIKQAKLDELHLQTHGVTKARERELVESLQHWIRQCAKKLARTHDD